MGSERGMHQRDDWPKWTGWLVAALMASLAISVTISLDVSPGARTVAGLLLGLAVVPFVLDAMGLVQSYRLHAAAVLIPLGVFNLAGERLAFSDHEAGEAALLAVILYAGQLCATAPPKVTAVGLIAAVAMVIGRTVTDPSFDGAGFWVGGILVAAVAGWFMRTLLDTLRQVRATQADLARQAAVEERQRVAREVHDVIAHSLTVTMLHLGAARLAVGRDDRTAATEALEEAERAGRQSLADIRRTVGLLRDGKSGATDGSLPAAPDVPDLVEHFRAAGLTVSLDVAGDLAAVAPATGLVTYRIVQEALANAARHSPGASADVDVTVNGGVAVRITSRGGTFQEDPGDGLGLLGMRERAEALGGRCRAGPAVNGWLVEAELPE